MKSYLRFLSRNKLYTAIEVVGLSVALAFVIVLSSYIVNDMSVNKVLKNTDDVYMVHGLERSDCFSEVPALYETMPEIKSSCGMVHSGRNPSLFNDLTTVSHGETKMNAKILGASDTFFDFFTFPLLEGDPENALSSKYSVVISEEIANTLFPDGDALGKEINVFERNPFWQWSDEPVEDLNVNLTVTGIFKPFSRTVFIEPDIIMNLDLIFEKQESLFGGGMRIVEYSFVKLDKEADPNSLCSTLTTEFKKVARNYDPDSFKMELVLTPFDDIKKQDPQTFGYNFDNIRQGRLFGIYLLMCIFIAIVSLLDYIVLTIAFSRFRIKEIATRQLLGTDRKGIIGRCFAEAFMLLAVSCIFAVIIALAFKDHIGQILGAEINPLSQLNEYLILAGIIVIMVAIASAVPSLILSSYNAVNVIKGEARYRDKAVYGKGFIGLAGLLCMGALSICFGVTRQTRHILNQPFGFSFDNIVCVGFVSDQNRFIDELEYLPFVDKVGSFQTLPTSWTMTNLTSNVTNDNERITFIDGNTAYFNILGIEILEDNGSGSADSVDGKWYVC